MTVKHFICDGAVVFCVCLFATFKQLHTLLSSSQSNIRSNVTEDFDRLDRSWAQWPISCTAGKKTCLLVAYKRREWI